MKTSVLIIAHNEERNISRCIKSILSQTVTPDEICVVCHNCADRTYHIASSFSGVTAYEYTGPIGVTHARMFGFKQVSGELIFCIDGDAYAEKNWIFELSRPFREKNVVCVGGVVIYTGVLIPLLNSLRYFYVKPIFDKFFPMLPFYPFGPSFAIRKDVYEQIGGLSPFIELRAKLNLIRWPDDAYLGFMCHRIGKVILTKKTIVFARAKEKNSIESIQRGILEFKAGRLLKEYFNKKDV